MNTILHKWRFFRSGGFDQVHLETAADLKSLGELDPKLWAALSCPTSNLEFDGKTLEFIDTDSDGHICVPEIITAVNWAASLLKNPEDLTVSARVIWYKFVRYSVLASPIFESVFDSGK